MNKRSNKRGSAREKEARVLTFAEDNVAREGVRGRRKMAAAAQRKNSGGHERVCGDDEGDNVKAKLTERGE